MRQEHKNTDTFLRLNGKQRLKESALILALLSAVFIFVSLFSYDPSDPSWSQTAWDGIVKNAAGNAGAWLADTLFFALGTLAYPLPFLFVMGGWYFFKGMGNDPDGLNYTIIATKILGIALLLLTSAGLAGLNFDDFGYFSSGGVVGDVLISLSMPIFNVLGTTLVFIFVWAAGFTLFSGISWLTIVDKIGERTLFGITKAVNFVRREKDHTYDGRLDMSSFDDERVPGLHNDRRDPIDIHMLEKEGAAQNAQRPIIHGGASKHITPYSSAAFLDESHAPAWESHDEENLGHDTKVYFEKPVSLVPPLDQKEDGSSKPVITQPQSASTPTTPTTPAKVFKNVYKKPPPSAIVAPVQTEFSPAFEDEPVLDRNKTIGELEDEANNPTLRDRSLKNEDVVEETFVDDGFSQDGFSQDLSAHAPFADDPFSEDPFAYAPVLDKPHDPFNVSEESAAYKSPLNETHPDETPLDDAPFEEIAIGNQDGLSELERAQKEAGFPEEDLEQTQEDPLDPFLETIREAQKHAAGATHPFLVKNEVNLPKPKEPLPTLDLLDPPRNTATRATDEELQHMAHLIETRLEDYKISVKVKGIFPGPVITRFELELAPGVKVSRIMGLSKDIARSLSATAVRVVDVIPGKPYVGLELPNASRETVFMSEVVASERFQSSKSPLSVVLGKDIAGEAVVTDLGKAPHMLVAGTTGSGKSVGVNVMIVSILYKAGPEDVRFIMIDPKMLELSVYEGIPHLLTEVVTDMKDAGNALRWCVAEMERRYKIMSALGVRNIEGYNAKIKEAKEADHPIPDPFWKPGDNMLEVPPMLEKLPFIVVIVDEFADLMMVVGKKVEELIARLAQKARAAGIHLVLATQRPSVDVITGLIKANIPTRVAFTVSTKTDSRTILDQSGADSLLGMGDMLFMPNGTNHPVRVHGAFVNDDEVHRVVSNWKARGKPQYIKDIVVGDQGADGLLPGETPSDKGDELDQLFDQVVEFVTESRRASVSGVQRRFKIGYNRAARIVEQLEAQGIVSAPGNNSNREVLAPPPLQD